MTIQEELKDALVKVLVNRGYKVLPALTENSDGTYNVPVQVKPGTVFTPTSDSVAVATSSTTIAERTWDVIVRSLNTALAVYTAFVVAGGFDIIHVGTAIQVKLTALTGLLTALLYAGIKVYQSQTNS
jgi:hypothetical protein